MPYPLQKRSPHSFAILPITLSTSLSLIATLSYLQLLYATSYLLRLLQGPRRNPAPLRDTIDSIETRTVDTLFRIIPVSLYRSPPASGLLHEDPLGHRVVSAARPSQPISHFRSHSHISHASSETAVADDLLQCYPANAVERMISRVQYTSAPRKSGQSTHNENASSKSIIYEAIKPAPKMSRPPIPAMMDQQEQTTSTQQVTQTESIKHNQQSEETQVPETCDTQSSALVPDMPDTLHPPDQTPKTSLDEPSGCGVGSISTKSSDSYSVPLTRTPPPRSTESYPGRYPVSNGLNLSDLATAPYAFRERGTILVRPFSDY